MPGTPIGGGFLLEDAAPQEVFTPEDFTEEHKAIARTTAEFFANEVQPKLAEIERQEPGVAAKILKAAAELGLTAVVVPERYGGMEMDLVSALIVAEHLSKEGSYSPWHGAHSGIGTLPVLLFGSEEQKQRYLPRLCRAELLGAYALSEPQAGSDAMNIRTRADLSADGSHYVLNGQKMWITNGGAADLYTVFAKVGGEHFTAFLVERVWPGVSAGAEEKKMGIKGSSTTAVYFDNVKVPSENVLGEIGRGHKIAFNILNLGRLKLGPATTGAAKRVLEVSLEYSKQRQAFGKPIAEFGLIRHKLAEMAVRIFAAESMSYRVGGLIQQHSTDMLASAEEFAVEASYVKVFTSEVLDYVADEGVQIHGGYGFHQDYMVEHAYRDARINRIFEGTNEINRMLATGILLKRAQRGQLGLVAAVKKLQGEILSPPQPVDLVRNAKKAALFCIGVAYQRYKEDLEHQQEVLAGLTDIAMTAFAMESVSLRARKMSNAEHSSALGAVFLDEGMETIGQAARAVLAASSVGDALRTNLAVLRGFTKCDPIDAIATRRGIAGRLLDAGKYFA